ncbi:MAG: membrane protein insertase YidC [Vicinamibacterales bacterium]
MERRVLLAIFLAFLVLYGYQMLLVPPPPQPAETATQPVPAAAASATESQPAQTAAPPSVAVAPEAATSEAEPLVSDTTERPIRVETPTVVATFTNRGARLQSWRLKNYLDASGQPQELIPEPTAAGHPLPLSLRADDEALTATLNSALYRVSGAPSGSATITSPTSIAFEYSDNSGLQVRKTFRLDPATYVVRIESSVLRNNSPVQTTVEWGPGLASTGIQRSSWVRGSGGVLYLTEIERIAPDSIAEQPARDGDFRYVGVEDHYFLSVVIRPGPSQVTYQAIAMQPPPGSEEAAQSLVSYSVRPTAPAAGLDFFVGPKDFDVLAGVDSELVRAIDFGMFAFLVVPLLRALSWINAYVGNYGFSIIILTVLINAVMFPLRHKSVVSMRRMQAIQPEAKAIQERYKNLKATDPAKQKMNQELMALYRERGVNPASGCIPMLLTFPVLLAFYSLLTVSIELRGAPFIGWIQDLSQPDPLYITPVLMGASQFLQMSMTPQVGVDPAQQKMMKFMPVLFMVFFLWTPAGTVLYWFVSNLWAIGQQYLTNYIIGPPQVRMVRPPAERKVKRVGSGKTSDAAGNEK